MGPHPISEGGWEGWAVEGQEQGAFQVEATAEPKAQRQHAAGEEPRVLYHRRRQRNHERSDGT